ncbi:MAG: hypothetical protein WC530_01565 [Candidatus Omnitrophota bacterium]
MSIQRKIGEEVARARRAAGMTQQELARHAKTRQSQYRSISVTLKLGLSSSAI